jgi:hypothetical protein
MRRQATPSLEINTKALHFRITLYDPMKWVSRPETEDG